MHAKNDQERAKFFKKTLSLAFDKFWVLNFVDINIENFPDINFAITVTETLYFLASSLILQIMNFLVLLFGTLCILEPLRHYFFHLYGHLKTIKNYNHYCC